MSLSHTQINYSSVGCSDIGRQRKLNEDSYYIDQSMGLILVADGMGGHNQGEIASGEAIKLIHQSIVQQKTIDRNSVIQSWPNDHHNKRIRTQTNWINPYVKIVEQAVQHANTVLHAINKDNGYSDNQGMGTTVVGAWIHRQLGKAIIFHVGDSRAYIHRSGHLLQLTKDHSLYQQWLDYGRIGSEPSKNIILQAIGLIPQVATDIKIQNLNSGDLILLCTDGLINQISDQEINLCLNRISTESIENLCELLVQQANYNGGTDNITAAIAQYI